MGSLEGLEGGVEVGGIGNDAAITKDEDSSGMPGDVQVVSDQNHGDFLMFVELFEEFDDFTAGA
jgi:hypothetical protein